MDYRLTDEWADPRGVSDELYTESLVRLPNGFLCYKPLDDCPDVSPAPESRNGYVTFGCFNNSAKINNNVLDAWSRILTDLPDARMLLKSKQLHGPGLQQRIRKEFARRGVNPERVEMLGRVNSTLDHLALYGRVDIALDTFPYNGTTTTCEALWMGAPVIALAGDRHAGRVGVSLLHGMGLEELIATSPDEYRRLANDLARDRDRLAAYRDTLRTRMRRAPLTDAAGFARDIEAAFRTMWHSWCKTRAQTGTL
jgi:protein O-GlcNAc transferase